MPKDKITVPCHLSIRPSNRYLNEALGETCICKHTRLDMRRYTVSCAFMLSHLLNAHNLQGTSESVLDAGVVDEAVKLCKREISNKNDTVSLAGARVGSHKEPRALYSCSCTS